MRVGDLQRRYTRFNVYLVFIGNSIVINVLLGDEVEVIIDGGTYIKTVTDIALKDFNLDLVLGFQWNR